jgi:hypothetical protein
VPGLANHSARTRVADLICRGGASGQDFLLCARAEGGGISSFLRIYCEPCTSGLTPGKAAASYLGKLTGGACQRASEPASQRASEPASQPASAACVLSPRCLRPREWSGARRQERVLLAPGGTRRRRREGGQGAEGGGHGGDVRPQDAARRRACADSAGGCAADIRPRRRGHGACGPRQKDRPHSHAAATAEACVCACVRACVGVAQIPPASMTLEQEAAVGASYAVQLLAAQQRWLRFEAIDPWYSLEPAPGEWR